jgi:hypothetical protein
MQEIDVNLRKAGAGRPKNSLTTTQVSMLELLRVLQPDALVTVGTKFAESLGLKKINLK